MLLVRHAVRILEQKGDANKLKSIDGENRGRYAAALTMISGFSRRISNIKVIRGRCSAVKW